MSDTLRQRERGEELKFQMDADTRFRAESRRNRLLGEWLAERFGMTSDEAKAYAKAVVASDLDEPGIEDMMRKVMKDIEDRGAPISEADVRKKVNELYAVALAQVQADYKPGTV